VWQLALFPLPFVVIPNERSEEESLFARQFQQPHCNPPRLLGGRSFSSDKKPGTQRFPFAAIFPRAFYSAYRFPEKLKSFLRG
jgi:hypothetical protein